MKGIQVLLLSVLTNAELSERSERQVCPRLSCSEDLSYHLNLGDVGHFEDLAADVCFMHSGTNPVEWIKFDGCPEDQICDLPNDYAWIMN